VLPEIEVNKGHDAEEHHFILLAEKEMKKL